MTTYSGSAGITFDITETDTTTSTGSVTQEYIVSGISDLTLSTSDIVYSVYGSVGTTSFEFDLNSVSNQSGTGYSTSVIRNNAGDYTTLKMIVIQNTHASNTLTIGSPSANSLWTWNSSSDTIAIDAGAGMSFSYSTAKTISTNGKIKIVGSSASTTFKIFILGT